MAKKDIKGLFSSENHKWETPDLIFNDLNRVFNFTLDVCATNKNTKIPENYFSPADNGLEKDWQNNVCFMNPPYGRDVQDWVKKAYNESLKGTTVVALVPARTDTKWFQDCWKADYLYFIKGRVKFKDEDGNSTGSATFPSVLVIWNYKENFELNFEGKLIKL